MSILGFSTHIRKTSHHRIGPSCSVNPTAVLSLVHLFICSFVCPLFCSFHFFTSLQPHLDHQCCLVNTFFTDRFIVILCLFNTELAVQFVGKVLPTNWRSASYHLQRSNKETSSSTVLSSTDFHQKWLGELWSVLHS